MLTETFGEDEWFEISVDRWWRQMRQFKQKNFEIIDLREQKRVLLSPRAVILDRTESDHKILILLETVVRRWKSSACIWSDWTVFWLGKTEESFSRRFEHFVRENKRSNADSNRLVNERDQPGMYSDTHRTLFRESFIIARWVCWRDCENNFTYFERAAENI